jgi:hypothetical protein
MASKNPLEVFVELASSAKDRALEFSVKARDHATDVSQKLKTSSVTVSERLQNGKVFSEPDGGGAIVLRSVQTVCTVVGAMSLFTYLVPTFYHKLSRPQNLAKKYGAKWALVTGGSSGIVSGEALQTAASALTLTQTGPRHCREVGF